MKSLKVGVLALSTVLLLGACGTSKVKPEDTRKVLEKNGYVVVIKNAEEFKQTSVTFQDFEGFEYYLTGTKGDLTKEVSTINAYYFDSSKTANAFFDKAASQYVSETTKVGVYNNVFYVGTGTGAQDANFEKQFN